MFFVCFSGPHNSSSDPHKTYMELKCSSVIDKHLSNMHKEWGLSQHNKLAWNIFKTTISHFSNLLLFFCINLIYLLNCKLAKGAHTHLNLSYF